jgi:hypothetical protein
VPNIEIGVGKDKIIVEIANRKNKVREQISRSQLKPIEIAAMRSGGLRVDLEGTPLVSKRGIIYKKMRNEFT